MVAFFRLAFAAALFGLTAAACAAPQASVTNPQPAVAPPLARAPGEWVELTPRPVAIDGRLVTPGCSGAPGADPAFKFWARRGRENALVIFFDGGGACWDDATCARPHLASSAPDARTLYKAELLSSDDPRHLPGMFDLNDPRNPVRDWSFVFVPYCTGDVHAGSNTAHYINPETHQAFSISHHGIDNFEVVLAWMRANFLALRQVLVTGSSAGAYGAVVNYASVRDAFPAGRAVMLGDAGQGVAPASFGPVRNANWGFSLPRSVFGPHPELTADSDLVSVLAAHYPTDRFAQYTTLHDHTQIGFFALMGAAHPCAAWTSAMVGDLVRREDTANFRAYLAAGETHTILRSPLFYAETSGGARFSDWLASTLRADGSAWRNEACARCLAPPSDC